MLVIMWQVRVHKGLQPCRDPWLVVLGVLGLRARPGPGLRRFECAAAAVSLAASIALNAPGAISRSAADWNHGQTASDFQRRLWDWSDPPFLRW